MCISKTSAAILVLLFLLGLGSADYLLLERPRSQRTGRNTANGVLTNLDLMTIAREAGFDFLPVSGREQSFLAKVLPESHKHILRSIVLLQGEERVAAIYWYRSSSSDSHLHTVKSWMYELFSGEMTNLVDETLTREELAPITVLAFTDPSMSEERFLFAKIRDHLYEFHFQQQREPLIHGLLQELARDS